MEHKGNKHDLNFVVVDQNFAPFLGLKSSHCKAWVSMGLIKIMVSDDDKNSVNNVTEASKRELVRSYCVCQKRSRAWTVRGGI